MISVTPITTERLVLRLPEAHDLAEFTAFFNSDRARFAGGKPDAAAAFDEFAAMCGHWVLRGFGSFIMTLRDSGRAIGHAGLVYPGAWPEPELGWSIWHDKDEGHGFATEAVIAARTWALELLNTDTLVSYIAPPNLASIKLARRVGAIEDPAAAPPAGLTCQVWRHTLPEAAQ